MRVRVAFKLNGNDADLARQLEQISGVALDKIAKVAFLRYVDDVIARAEQAKKELEAKGLTPADLQGDVNGHNEVHAVGTVPPPPDAVSGEELSEP